MKYLRRLYYAFPVQLLLLHLRSNLLLLSLWVLLLLMLSGWLGQRLGLQYLFLDPEYIGRVGFWGFFLTGTAFGGFLMSWNLTLYLLCSQYFPFLASVNRPFTKFSINNMVLPLIFTAAYCGQIAFFQRDFQNEKIITIVFWLVGFLLGVFTLVLAYAVYFFFTNRDITHYRRAFAPPNLVAMHIAPGRRNVDLEYIKTDEHRIRVDTYLGENLRPRLVRSVAHYETKLLLNIFKQNHFNALALQLITMVTLLLFGYLIDSPFFKIPAGASLMILFSLIVAVVGAITYWFSEWRAFVLLLILAVTDIVTSFTPMKHPNQAYGINYDLPKAIYSNERLMAVLHNQEASKDLEHTRAILRKRVAKMPERKPKLIVLCASGGGLKAAYWSGLVLQTADSLSQGQLMDQTVLMTGASGGMMGLSYMRELYHRQLSDPGQRMYHPQHLDNVSKDVLNAVMFTMVSTDIFLPWSPFSYAGKTYFKDRGYSFEQQFNENTLNLLGGTLGQYKQPEQEGDIPMLLLTPSIVNDGRQLIISPQPLTYLMFPPAGLDHPGAFEVDAVDMGYLLGRAQTDSLRFLSAIRMNATYPYVLPTVHLPTQPEIEVMDAGFRDNYGILSATRYLQYMRPWIERNTSGVVLVQISSSEQIENIQSKATRGLVSRFFNPLGIAGKVLALQEFEHDGDLSFLYELYAPGKFELIRFIYLPEDEGKLRAAVSLHLTGQEKQDITNALSLPHNRVSMRRLLELLRRY